MVPVLSVLGADGGSGSGCRSGATGTTAGTMREEGPSMMPAGMNSTFSGAPIANAAALRADRQL